MNRLFIAIVLSLSTLLFSCSDESSSNSSRGADGADAVDASADNVSGTDSTDDTDDTDDTDGESSSNGDSAGSIPSSSSVPSGGAGENPSDAIDARNDAIQQDLNSGSQSDPLTTTDTDIEPTTEPIELEPIDNEDENSLDTSDN